MSAATERAPAPESEPVATTGRGPGWIVGLLWPAASGLGAIVLAIIVLRAWNGALHVPFAQSGDGNYTLLLIKTVLEHGWLGVNPDIGAPYGGVLYDHTVAYGDTSQLLIIKVLGLGSSDPAAVLNVFYLLTYGMIASITCLVLRSLRFSGPVAAVASVVYALLPYHFFRGESHLFLGTYYAVPVGCWLVLGIMGRVALFARREAPSRRVLTWATRRTGITLAACALVGTSEVYYALFTVILAVMCGLLVSVVNRSWRTALTVAVVCGAVLGAAVIVQAPTIVYHAKHGGNPAVGNRLPIESEIYALKPAALILPSPDHRITALGEIGKDYFPVSLVNGEGSSPVLGMLLSVGFLLVLLSAAAVMAGARREGPRQLLLRDSGVVVATILLTASVGGVSTLIAYLVTPQVRGWNRISVFVAFFAAVGLAALLSRAGEGLRRRGTPVWVGGLLLLLVPAFAAWEQSGKHEVFAYAGSLASWRNDARFVRAADAILPPRAMVLQLPYVPFPENPPLNKMTDYDELKGYLHESDLRWSYGGIKGRQPDDWGASMAGVPMSELVPAAVAAGFAAIYVDRFGYADEGKELTAELTDAVGGPPAVTSETGRLELFDLSKVAAAQAATPAAVREAAGAALVRPIVPQWTGGFYAGVESDAKNAWRWATATGTIKLKNSSRFARSVRIRFAVHTPGTVAQHVTITLPDGTVRRVRTRPGKQVDERLDLTLPRGTSSIGFTTDAPDDGADPRDLRLQLLNPSFADLGYARLVRARR